MCGFDQVRKSVPTVECIFLEVLNNIDILSASNPPFNQRRRTRALDSSSNSAMEAPARSSIQQCQEGQHYALEDSSCANTYSCSLTWEISKVHQRKIEATNILFSPPFYTAQNGGYKMCLFLYMDGDGTGKGTHLSFYVALMRGEYDAQLPWPFRQKVTLILVNQDRQQHIAKWFQPDPMESDSFQQPSPHSELNVAAGCPKFAPLSVLDNPSYVKDDTMILKCIVDTTEIV